MVIVRAGKGDGLVGRASLRATDADLRAGREELGAAEAHGELEADDLVPDEVISWGYVLGKRQRDGAAVHCQVFFDFWRVSTYAC